MDLTSPSLTIVALSLPALTCVRRIRALSGAGERDAGACADAIDDTAALDQDLGARHTRGDIDGVATIVADDLDAAVEGVDFVVPRECAFREGSQCAEMTAPVTLHEVLELLDPRS